MRAPVGRVPPPLDQPALFELVHQEHHARGVQAQQVPQGLLRRPFAGGQPEQHPGLALFQAERREQLTERARGEEAQLDQEQAEPAALVFVRPGRRIAGHSGEDYHRNKYLRSEIIATYT